MKKRLVDLKVGDIVSLRINSNSKIKKYIYLGIDKEDIVSFDTLNLYMQLLKEGRMYFILLPYQYANNDEWTHNYIKYAPMQNLNHKYKVETDEELAKRITLAVVKRKLLIENFPAVGISVQDYVDRLKKDLNEFIVSRNLDKLQIGNLVDDKYVYLGITDNYRFKVFDINKHSTYRFTILTYQPRAGYDTHVYKLNYKDLAEHELSEILRCINC